MIAADVEISRVVTAGTCSERRSELVTSVPSGGSFCARVVSLG
jgi:hypothetical protein